MQKKILIIMFLFVTTITSSIESYASWSSFWNSKKIDFNEYPWLGALSIQGGNRQCSASLISPYIILTAAHCIHLFNRNPLEIYAYANRVTFYLQYNEGSYLEKRHGRVVATGDAVRYKNINTEDDWAIIILNEEINNISHPSLEFNPRHIIKSEKARLALAGYPNDNRKGEKPIISRSCKISKIENNVMTSNCYVYKQMSGGPAILLRRNKEPVLVGSVTAGNPTRVTSLKGQEDILKSLLGTNSIEGAKSVINDLEREGNQYIIPLRDVEYPQYIVRESFKNPIKISRTVSTKCSNKKFPFAVVKYMIEDGDVNPDIKSCHATKREAEDVLKYRNSEYESPFSLLIKR